MSGVIQFSRMGVMGRWGNQIFQTAFLDTYARRFNLRPEMPPWVGEQLFELDNVPRITKKLPTWGETTDENMNPVPPVGAEVVNHDFAGYGQYHTSWYAPDRESIQRLFAPRWQASKRMWLALDGFSGGGGLTVGIHLRRGDYGQLIYYITPVEWYLHCLAFLRTRFGKGGFRLFVSSEDRSLVDAFKEYDPMTAESLGVDLKAEPLPHYNYLDHDRKAREPWQMDFFPDWYLLSKCDILLIPNSTFSFTAAWLNPNLRACYRSSLPLQGFERIDPWNTYPLTQDLVEDYPHVPGIGRDASPYWSRQNGQLRRRVHGRT